MNTIRQSNPTRVTVPAGMSELVRGSEAMLVAKLAPMVRQCDVALDMKPVKRIDEILRLVGLEAILVSHEEVAPETRVECHAA